MHATSRPAALKTRAGTVFAPKIYYFHPLLGGPRDGWPEHLARARDLSFDHLLTAPLFTPGAAGDIFLAADHERANPAVAAGVAADELIAELAEACRAHGLRLLVDIVVGRVAADAALVAAQPNWFYGDESAGTLVDPRAPLRQPDAAHARFDKPALAQEIAGWWIERLQRLARAGAAGFRCEDPHAVPPALWPHIIGAVKSAAADCRFLAWTPGLDWHAVAGLRGCGFDAAFSSVAWWDGRTPWFIEEHDLLRGIGSVIGAPEAPFGPRLARRLHGSAATPLQYRHALRRAAATGNGLMIPMGFEFGAADDMDRRSAAPGELPAQGAATALTAEVRDANSLADQLAELGIGGEMRLLDEPGEAVTALLCSDTADVRDAGTAVAVLINTELEREAPLPISFDPLPASAGAALAAHEAISAERDCHLALAPGEVRLVAVQPTSPVKLRRSDSQAAKAVALPRVAIENIAPAVDGGRYPAKRIVGDSITVDADLVTDGHEMLAVELVWRAADETGWQRAPMQPLGNDRWQAAFRPDRVGRYEFSIEAWWDRYGTFCRDLELKRQAGADLTVEFMEGRELLGRARERAGTDDSKIIGSALHWLADASSDAAVEIFLSRDLREVMHESEERLFLARRDPALAIDVERPQAAFGSWYELFPRSATDDPNRHGTFDDVIRRLPAIRDMGFDVLYMPPIHPIGTTNRKGKNNSLHVEPDDHGSPYAIGSREGGHDAIHPALGDIDGFRRLRAAAAANGMEIALDFAIQCSPDHPWLKEHPEWFNWRPDGTVRYAENPPKKYQDIVNVDFYGAKAFPGLWIALRDTVLYWCGEGVRIFRVDNPHTKPLPFWEWLIGQVRGRYPEAIFLAEAFTRPKMMYRLGKVGFSQSYTYFTWRNTKQELTDYFTELTTTEVKDYYRPHLFVNTPDINPYFLQSSGRPGFLIRAALATTLSGLWGMYSGFEICESAPLPGREEYLDSEKYQIRVRDYNAPGNIKDEITRLNRIRRSHPALQSHLGLRFYPAHDDQVLLYGKMAADRSDMILVAVSLDPFHARELTIEVPLWEWSLADNTAVAATDLMRDHAFVWHGKLQRLRLDPAELPFAVWRLTPRLGG